MNTLLVSIAVDINADVDDVDDVDDEVDNGVYADGVVDVDVDAVEV